MQEKQESCTSLHKHYIMSNKTLTIWYLMFCVLLLNISHELPYTNFRFVEQTTAALLWMNTAALH